MFRVLWPAQAAIYSSGNVNSGGESLNLAIPDGSPFGVTSTLEVSGAAGLLSDLTVTLNVSGGYNGDDYAYVEHDGILVTLLDRVGTGAGDPIQSAFGYSTDGFNNVTLDDAATGGSIHNAQNPGSLPAVSYTSDGGSLAAFDGMDPNGTWTLFIADESAGNAGALNGWSLDIATVPEPPASVPLVISLVMLTGASVCRRCFRAVKRKPDSFLATG